METIIFIISYSIILLCWVYCTLLAGNYFFVKRGVGLNIVRFLAMFLPVINCMFLYINRDVFLKDLNRTLNTFSKKNIKNQFKW